MEPGELVEGIRSGKTRYLAKAISLVENHDPMAYDIIRSLFGDTGHAHYIGITGNPGAGKSTLINELARSYLTLGKKVAVVAVDPSSPITGGAVLGDRIRIDSDLMGGNFFFRSISNRSHLGGLSSTTFESVLLLDAFGFDTILIETVGTGQSETSVATVAHTNLVLMVPGLGDGVQAEKAGLLEIGDVFVVNKSDLPGAKELRAQLKSMLSLRMFHRWTPRIVMTDARNAKGIDELIETIGEHEAVEKTSPNLERAESFIKEKIEEQVKEDVVKAFQNFYAEHPVSVEEFLNREISHVEIAKEYSKRFFDLSQKTKITQGGREK